MTRRLSGEVARAAIVLLNLRATPGARRDAAGRLAALFADVTGLPPRADITEPSGYGTARDLPSGLAIAPAYAALCLEDYARTASFALGIDAALAAAERRFPGQRLRVLYAGTGPFAALAAVLAPRLDPGRAGFTMIDVHPVAARTVPALFRALGIGDCIDEMVTGDALTWRPRGPGYHVAVTEVMQRALAKEPQVAMTAHLARCLVPGGVLVPERVALDLALFRHNAACAGLPGARPPRYPLGTALELTAARARAIDPDAQEIALPDLAVPAGAPPDAPLNVLTRIETYGGHSLAENQSGLTTVETLWHLPPIRPGARLALSYALRPVPGLSVAPVARTVT